MSKQLQLTLQPRLQSETWSLYWKDTTKTTTDCLKPIQLGFDVEATTVANLIDQVQHWTTLLEAGSMSLPPSSQPGPGFALRVDTFPDHLTVSAGSSTCWVAPRGRPHPPAWLHWAMATCAVQGACAAALRHAAGSRAGRWVHSDCGAGGAAGRGLEGGLLGL